MRVRPSFFVHLRAFMHALSCKRMNARTCLVLSPFVSSDQRLLPGGRHRSSAGNPRRRRKSPSRRHSTARVRPFRHPAPDDNRQGDARPRAPSSRSQWTTMMTTTTTMMTTTTSVLIFHSKVGKDTSRKRRSKKPMPANIPTLLNRPTATVDH